MKISKFLKQQFFLFFSLFFLVCAFFISNFYQKPPIIISKQESTLNLNSKLIQFFHMGQKRLISSSMWIATILESDLEHYNQKDMNSWMFLRFKTISDLEPRFYENYYMGAVYLSIVKDDLVGASYIYDKGLIQFPDDYVLLKNAAFHNEFEVGDSNRAFEIYSKLKTHPKSDPTIISIAARLESQLGSKDAAFALLLSQYEKFEDKNSFLAKAIFESLYSLKCEIDLDCLNSKLSQCSKVDLENQNYIWNGVKFVARKPWRPFRLYHRPKNN